MIRIALIFLLIFLFLTPLAADAQSDMAAIDAAIGERRKNIDTIRAKIAEPGATNRDLIVARKQLRDIRSVIDAILPPLEKHQEELQADIDQLGPAPDDGRTEPSQMTREREDLTKLFLRESALIRRAKLNLTEINRLLEQISQTRREVFVRQLLIKSPSAFTPATIASAWSTSIDGVTTIIKKSRSWIDNRKQAGTILASSVTIGLSVLISLLIFGPLRRWVNAAFLHRLQALPPTAGRRAGAVVIRTISRALPGFIAGLIILSALMWLGLITENTREIARQIWFGFVAILIADAGVTAVVAPSLPGWRLVPLESRSGYILRGTMSLLVFIIFLDRTLRAATVEFGASPEFVIWQYVVVSTMIVLVFLFLSRSSNWRLSQDAILSMTSGSKTFWNRVRIGLRVFAAIVLGAMIFGYIPLAHYLTTKIVIIIGLLALGITLHLVTRDFVNLIHGKPEEFASPSLDSEPERIESENILQFWLVVLADLVIISLLLPIAYIALGADWSDVGGVIKDAFYGFQIGNFEISLAKILAAIGVFLLILLVSRSVQKTATTKLFPKTRLDTGLQNTLNTLIGYVGLVIAFMTGVSMLGFNLSNLAIIAGALSVGIGFGLQSIVNNFVSGLILLFERPIKVGDWIVVASGEGFVKQISVRSTEIETFDRSSIIVPNSELISGTVQNWTHKDKIGRFTVPVGVSYDSDPEQVAALLAEVAKEHSQVLSSPEPFIYFAGFGDSSLDFEIRAFVRDVTSSLRVRNEIRMAIFKKLKLHGVEIPYPQRDLHIRSGAFIKSTDKPI